jgi:uncharacterized protein YneF (UPF0154 family)
MNALIAIIILIPLICVMGLCFYAQWQMMKIMKNMPSIWSTSAAVQFMTDQSNDESSKT